MRRAVLVGRCSDLDNVFVGEIEDKEGRPFSAIGHKSACGSRLCPSCLKLLQRRSQRRLVDVRDEFWKQTVREPGKFERFVTLTGPTLQGMSLEATNRLYNLAFEKLNDRIFWSSRVDACAKHVEFTVNPRGYHTHIHLLIYGLYMERDAIEETRSREWRARRRDKLAQQSMRIVKDDLPPLGNLQAEWTSCLTEAARAFGREIEWNASPSYEGWYSRLPDSEGEVIELQPTTASAANVHVCFVREKGRPSDGEIGLSSAVKELTKYLTKASSWSEVSDDQLVEIAEVRRWPRCFDLLGKWRGIKKSAIAVERPVLLLKAGETWEEFCKRVVRAQADPSSYVIAWDSLNASHSLYSASNDADASLDTDFIKRSGCDEATESPPRKLWLKAREPSLMEIGESMSFKSWLTLVSIRLANTRHVRRRQLEKQYPDAHFFCLDGSEFGGLRRSAASAEPTMMPATATKETFRLAA